MDKFVIQFAFYRNDGFVGYREVEAQDFPQAIAALKFPDDDLPYFEGFDRVEITKLRRTA